MPFVFAFVGVMLVAIGLRGRASDASALLASEFTGSNSFVRWFLAIMILGLIGYYKPVKPVADAMLGLVIVAIILTKGNPNAPGGGFFAQLNDAFTGAKPLAPQKVISDQSAGIFSNAQNPSPTALQPNPVLPPVGGSSSVAGDITNAIAFPDLATALLGGGF